MPDPRTPRTREAQLPDPLDQTPSEAAPPGAEEHGSEDAQLFAEAQAGHGEGDVETGAPQSAND